MPPARGSPPPPSASASASSGHRTSDVLCRYWQRGLCTTGDSCSFKHGPTDPRALRITTAPPASIKALCKFHAQGRCTAGARCPFSHSVYSADEAARRLVNQRQGPQPQTHLHHTSGAVAAAAPPKPQVFPPAPRGTSAAGELGAAAAAAAAAAQLSKLGLHDQQPDFQLTQMVEWELPSADGGDAYFYGAPGTFHGSSTSTTTARHQQQPQRPAMAWAKVAVAGVPEEVLAAEAAAEVASRAAFEARAAAAAAAAAAGPPPPAREVCKFFVAGTCRYGTGCRNAHTLPLGSSSDGGDVHGSSRGGGGSSGGGGDATGHGAAAHATAGSSGEAADESDGSEVEAAASAAAECSICCELVGGRRFGILTGCSHPFCLQCIREWRGVRGASSTATVRMCPLCRETSHFIVPSARLVTHPRRKAALIEAYKTSLAATPCRHWEESGGVECPFGGSCFYFHRDASGGHAEPPRLRLRVGAEGTEVQGEVRLSSFLEHSGRFG